MELTFYQTTSENNQVSKALSNPLMYSGILRDGTNVRNPQIVFASGEGLSKYNYCYIPRFGRYYYVNNWTFVRNELMTAEFKSDCLMSFPIRSCSAIVSNSENLGSKYLSNGVFQSLVKDTTDIVSFGGGLSNSGNYILITAGG